MLSLAKLSTDCMFRNYHYLNIFPIFGRGLDVREGVLSVSLREGSDIHSLRKFWLCKIP